MKPVFKISILICSVLLFQSCIKDKPVIPVLITVPVSGITTTEALAGGNVSDDGGADVITRGVCWATSDKPDITDNKTTENGGTGSFTSTITGLDPNTTYYVRAYATNSAGTAYGSFISFKTLGDKPDVASPDATEILMTSATLNGSVNPNSLLTTVTFEYGLTTDYGFTSTALESPLSGDSYESVTTALTGLNPGTTYHIKIKVTNDLGTKYSDDMTFTTYAMKDADNNLYHSVTIGTQTWMKSNLRTTHFNDNIGIPLVTDNADWNNLTTPGYSWYDNDETTYKETYGALYNWYAVSTGNLCPTGWHVPSEGEWATLINFLGGSLEAGSKLKETGTEHWLGSNPNATNESGFTCLPAGDRGNNGIFSNSTLGAYMWHSIEYSSWGGQITYIQYPPDAYIQRFNKELGASVRCLKDE
jgi:uncharacterized protein (TIGR02145 family)